MTLPIKGLWLFNSNFLSSCLLGIPLHYTALPALHRAAQLGKRWIASNCIRLHYRELVSKLHYRKLVSKVKLPSKEFHQIFSCPPPEQLQNFCFTKTHDCLTAPSLFSSENLHFTSLYGYGCTVFISDLHFFVCIYFFLFVVCLCLCLFLCLLNWAAAAYPSLKFPSHYRLLSLYCILSFCFSIFLCLCLRRLAAYPSIELPSHYGLLRVFAATPLIPSTDNN